MIYIINLVAVASALLGMSVGKSHYNFSSDRLLGSISCFKVHVEIYNYGHYIIKAHLKTLLLLRAQFLQYCALVRSCFEVALVPSELDPGIPLLLVGLEEGRPLNDVT